MAQTQTQPAISRRERPTRTDTSLPIVGAALGGLLWGPFGALLGGGFGVAASNNGKYSLEEAVRMELTTVGATLVSMERTAPNFVIVTIGLGGQYFSCRRTAPKFQSPDETEDWLFAEIVDWLATLGAQKTA
jgi:hypothetical protein